MATKDWIRLNKVTPKEKAAKEDSEFFAKLEWGKQFARKNFSKCLIALLQRQGYEMKDITPQKAKITSEDFMVFCYQKEWGDPLAFSECVIAALRHMEYEVVSNYESTKEWIKSPPPGIRSMTPRFLCVERVTPETVWVEWTCIAEKMQQQVCLP